MSEDIKPEVTATPEAVQNEDKTLAEKMVEKAAEVSVKVENAVEAAGEAAEEAKEAAVNYGEKTLAELSELFQQFSESVDRLKRSKEAEAIKAAFYRKLSKEKAEAGIDATVEESSAEEEAVEETAEVVEGPFAAIEAGFKSLYNKYKQEKAEYNRQIEEERGENLQKKLAVIEELKALVEKQDDVSASFPQFRELQARWRETGPVPVQNMRDVNGTYQLYVEKFYDLVQINRDLRDLDFKKNLEVKEQFCEQAEKLAEDENVVEAFHELQKLHEQWKEYGPVAKEFRESIWDRFKAATAVINKRYQAHFENLKEEQAENLKKKEALCERVEEIAEKEITSSNEWNTLSKAIEDIQAEWRKIGFATKKENQKIYDRFRAACDKFFARKREFYSGFKESMNENMEKKLALIEQAEALKDSTEWKKTTDLFINLQKQWKEIGAVPRKRSEQLWKRFRAACDAFFDERDRNIKPEHDYRGNLAAKKAIVEEIKAYTPSEDAASNTAAAEEFADRWQAIGFVPYKEKESIVAAYKEAMQAKFPDFSVRAGGSGPARSSLRSRSEKDRLVQKYNQLQQDVNTYENNMGFFSSSKSSEPFIKQMEEKIAAAKAELKMLEEKIRNIEKAESAPQE